MTNTREEADRIITKHALWALGVGLVPVPIVDVAAVTAVQLDMLRDLANIHGVDFSASKGKAFASALTGSAFARVGASAVKGVPVVGWVVGGVSMSVFSGAATYAVGKMAVQVFEKGGDLSSADLEAAKVGYRDWLEKGKQFISGLVTPGSGPEDVFQALESLQQLQEKGVITPEEYQAKKEELLSRI